jgi:hypothetical protein
VLLSCGALSLHLQQMVTSLLLFSNVHGTRGSKQESLCSFNGFVTILGKQGGKQPRHILETTSYRKSLLAKQTEVMVEVC